MSIAGTGLVCSLGQNTREVSQQILAGNSGLQKNVFHTHGPENAQTEWAAPVVFDPSASAESKLAQISMQACEQAISACAPIWSAIPSERRGLCFGISKPDFYPLESNPVAAECLPNLFPQQILSPLIQRFEISGPSCVPVAACATGAMAILQAQLMLQSHACDAVLVGSADCSCQPMVFGSYHRLGVLQSAAIESPHQSGPFSENRNGFSLGEGAGAMVLTRDSFECNTPSDHSIRIRSLAVGSDPTGLTVVDATGKALEQVVRQALEQAELRPSQIVAINVHGTGTQLNDAAEANAIARVFGPPGQQPPSFSFKPAIGHLLGATSSVELVLCHELLLQSKARDSLLLPPRLSEDSISADCPIRAVPNNSSSVSNGPVLKLALGFGGHLCALVLDEQCA